MALLNFRGGTLKNFQTPNGNAQFHTQYVPPRWDGMLSFRRNLKIRPPGSLSRHLDFSLGQTQCTLSVQVTQPRKQ